MILRYHPYREPLRTTLTRTITIAVGVGAAVSFSTGGGWRAWPVTTLLMLWPSFGGHWVELLFLNVLRPRLPADRLLHVFVRLATWFIGGVLLALCMFATAIAVGRPVPPRWEMWWMGGVVFIGIELIVHLVLQLWGMGSFYDGRR